MNFTFLPILPFLAFVAAVATVAGIYSLVSDLYLRDRARVSSRVDDEFRKRLRDRAKKSLALKELRDLMPASGGEEAQPSVQQRFVAMIEQSGLELTAGRLVTIAGVSALALGAAGGLLRQNILVGVVGAVIGAAVPVAYVNFKRNQRQEKLLSQLPDSFDLMSRVIRAGQTMAQGIQAVSDEYAPPVATEFAYCYEQQNLGLSPETSLRELARRTGLVEIKIFVLALLVQQQTGGNLAEMLDKLSGIVRERYKLRGKIKALTAEGRIQAMVLLALPPAMLVLMLFMNRDYAGILLENPSLIWATVISEALGALWIRKIVNFDF
jgi:tight adherence protein B